MSAPRVVERLKRVATSPAGYWLAVAAASAAAWSLWLSDGLLAGSGLPAVDLTRLADGIVSALPWFAPAVLVLAIAGVWHWLAGSCAGGPCGARAIDTALAAVALAGLPALALLVAVLVEASDTGPALLCIFLARPLRFALAPTLRVSDVVAMAGAAGRSGCGRTLRTRWSGCPNGTGGSRCGSAVLVAPRRSASSGPLRQPLDRHGH